MLQELKFIDENYLAEFKRQPPVPELRQQAAFDKIKEVSDHYPIGPEEDPSDKTFLELAFVAGGAGDQQLSMALDVLTDVLVNLPAAPLRRALQRTIESPLSKRLLNGEFATGDLIVVDAEIEGDPEDNDALKKGKIVFRKGERAPIPVDFPMNMEQRSE